MLNICLRHFLWNASRRHHFNICVLTSLRKFKFISSAYFFFYLNMWDGILHSMVGLYDIESLPQYGRQQKNVMLSWFAYNLCFWFVWSKGNENFLLYSLQILSPKFLQFIVLLMYSKYISRLYWVSQYNLFNTWCIILNDVLNKNEVVKPPKTNDYI